MRWPIEGRVVLALAVVIIVLGAVGFSSYQSTQSFAESGRDVARSQEFLREVEGLQLRLNEALSGELTFLVSRDERLLGPFWESLQNVGTHVQRMKHLCIETTQSDEVSELQDKIERRLAEIHRTIEAASLSSESIANGVVHEQASRMSSLSAELHRLSVREIAKLNDRSSSLQYNSRRASIAFLLMAVTTCGVLAYVFYRIMNDVRERRKAMRLLSHSEERYRLLAENSLDLIVLLDLKGTLIYASPSHAHVLGVRASDLVGRHLSEWVHPEDLTSVKLAVSRLENANIRLSLDVRLRKSGGAWLETEMLLSTFSVASLSGHRILISARDISERKQAQREREGLIRELQEAFAKIKVLSGFIPICSSCKKIRDDQGYWNQLEAYIQSHSEAQFSHGICPGCVQQLYPEFFAKQA